MPHLRIYGIPLAATQAELEGLTDAFKEKLVAMPELNITKKNVFVFYPTDRMEKGLGEEIICDAVLFDTPLRTPAIRKKFADTITETIQGFFPKSIAKCMAFNFDRDLGYSTRDPKPQEESGDPGGDGAFWTGHTGM